MNIGDTAQIGITLTSSDAFCSIRLWYMIDVRANISININLHQQEKTSLLTSIMTASKSWTRVDARIPNLLEEFEVKIVLLL